jgi:hypothetical protein
MFVSFNTACLSRRVLVLSEYSLKTSAPEPGAMLELEES